MADEPVQKEIKVTTPKWMWAGLLAAVTMNIVGMPSAQAAPLTPLTPAEVQYLEKLREVLALKHDPIAFNSDGELLDDGWYVCFSRDHGLAAGGSPNAAPPAFVGQGVTLLSPAVTQVAFAVLCPK
jgi:hypothetical protein